MAQFEQMAARSRSPDPSTRARSSTLVNPAPISIASPNQAGPSRLPPLSPLPRSVTDPISSAAATALSSHLQDGQNRNRPRFQPARTGHTRMTSWPTPPSPVVASMPSAPAVNARSGIEAGTDALFPRDRVHLLLYTYRPNATNSGPSIQSSQPSPLPSSSVPASTAPVSNVLFAHSAIPWPVRPDDYVEIRRVKRVERSNSRSRGMGGTGPGENKSGGEALKGLAKRHGRDGFVLRVGEDCPNLPVNQIQVPDTVAAAFKFQHRSEVEIVRLYDSNSANIDYVELRFSQYLGRGDMWRLAMSLEGTALHVGERLSLAGGAVRAEVHGIWRETHRHASGILTAKSKTIYRSKSSQVYIFIQLCQETWEFDEDGERYYEKVVHGFLPELFARWAEKGTSHLVTIIFFARVHYNPDEVTYLEQHDLTAGLNKDYAGRWCKDFFRVAIDFERRSDWNLSLSEIKLMLERSEREILLDFHLEQMKGRAHESLEQKRIVGRWSFAYEGNVLEAVNLALNPFDEHYIDRDLSRTGLSMTIVSPGTGHFAVDKHLLRLTTERMIDHGIGLDLVCLTKMPLHSVPLFSYVSKRPKKPIFEVANSGMKTKPATPDLLYFDAHLSSATDCELADCYSIPRWVNASFYSKTHDKPFRIDRFVPRCKMYEIQMLGILDHNLTTVTVPLLDIDDGPKGKVRPITAEDRKMIRDDFDAGIFGSGTTIEAGKVELAPVMSREESSVGSTSYQPARLLAIKADEKGEKRSPEVQTKMIDDSPKSTSKPLRNGTMSTERSPTSRPREVPPFEPLALQRTEVQATSPAPSSLSMGMSRSARAASFSRPSEPPVEPSSGASTPRVTPINKIKPQASKGSFSSRFGANWLLGALSGRSQPSFPSAAVETVGRQDVSSVTGNRSPSPVSTKSPHTQPRPVPGAPIVTPSTPSPARLHHNIPPTQPVPIASSRLRRATSDEEVTKSFKNSFRASKSPGDSWAKAAASNFNRDKSHVTLNPCNPKENGDTSFGEARRWQHIRPKPTKDSQHLVKWTSLSAPACLPLTTDFMPTPQEIQDFYEVNSYDIACYPDQVSFLVRPDAAYTNLPLAVMREMASQRLSQNFQFITLPHDHSPTGEENGRMVTTRKVLLPGDSTKDGLRVGGASEVLRDANGAIYLSWSNHIHRLAFDSTKQSVTIQRFVRKLRYSTSPAKYTCLVWPCQMKGYQEVQATFNYPNVEAKLNFNYLDRLIAGEEDDLTSSLRYWRTRYILIPSGRDLTTVQGVVPKGEQFNQSEILITGAFKVLEILSRNQWLRQGQDNRPLRLLPTTFAPSACVLDDGLMSELERLNLGEEQIERGKALEGMTLQTVAEMMCKPNNGLVIRDRWWNFKVHEDSFTGEQFCEWLMNTFTDVKTPDEAAEWGRSLFDKGLIEHVNSSHGFVNYGHFFYRIRGDYDQQKSKRKKPAKSWFGGGRPTNNPRDLIERHAAMSTSPASNTPLGKLTEAKMAAEAGGVAKKRKIKMSQSVIIDLDPGKKSDRAEVAVLHADIIHNSRNAYHFELNWIGVTAGLLDDLRAKCAAQAERYGLRFVEAPVEQIKDVSRKSAYRGAVPIPLALAPPIVPDLHLRLQEHDTGQTANYFEYAILTKKFGFILDVEAGSRYPDTIEVEYSYRGKSTFEYSQFCHRSGLALVQCVGGRDGFLWCDNRLFIAAPTRGRVGGGVGSQEAYPNAPVPAKLTRQEEARALRVELEAFCANPQALADFYEQVTPEPLEKQGEGEARAVEQLEEEEKVNGDGEVLGSEERAVSPEKVEMDMAA